MKLRILILTVIIFLVPIAAFSADWVPMTSGTTNSLNGIWGSSGSDVFAVGGAGTILHYNGSSWSSMTSGTTKYLHGVWGSSGSDVFAVGYYGTILHFNGSTWSSMTSGTTAHLQGVWGNSGSDVFAVGYDGDAGTILHYNGSTWSSMASGMTSSFYGCGVWGSSGSDVFAVGHDGDGGTILHYNGSTWSAMASGTTSNFYGYGVWGSSGSDVFAVGSGVGDMSPAIRYFDGNTWSFPFTGVGPMQRYGVWGSSGSDVFAVGSFGLIFHYDGSTWLFMGQVMENTLYGVWGSSGSDVFAVGAYGAIFHYAGMVTTTTVPSTVVSLIDFDAIPDNRMMTLSWSTASEIDTAGFNIYRAEAAKGEYVKINAALISAEGSSTQGAEYEFIDRDVRNRKTYYYKLEDIDLNGRSTFHGPASATPRLLYGGR